MRPLYENSEDRNKEANVANQIANYWLLTVVKLKPACEIDFALIRSGVVVAIMEVKCRNYSYKKLDELGGLMLSCHKMSALRRWHSNFPLGVAIAIQLTDGIYVWSIKSEEAFEKFSKIKMMGRMDRGDVQDIEPCVIIPMNKFRKIINAETIPTTSA
jgi:hypothetical protein